MTEGSRWVEALSGLTVLIEGEGGVAILFGGVHCIAWIRLYFFNQPESNTFGELALSPTAREES